jgi:hypothetical protein
MKRTMKTGVLVVLTVIAATACTRRVQVESEPNPNDMQVAPVHTPATRGS